MTEISSWSRK